MLKMYCVWLPFLLLVTDVVRCTQDYSFNSEARGWLKLHKTPATWEDAFLRCHDEGAVLASPLDKMLFNVLRRVIAQSGLSSHFFLGTHALFSAEDFLSVEGVPLSDMEVTLASRDVSTGNCLSMSADGRAYYSPCNNTLPFICYKRPVNQTMNECGTFDNEYQFNQRTGSCYKVHSKLQSWDKAFSTCASEGGHLVIINDAEEASIIKDMFPDHSGDISIFEQFHIGLVAWGKNRTWMTIHGERIEDVFNVWDSTQPDNFKGYQKYATFRRLAGKMDDIAIYAPAMFVCELPIVGTHESKLC